MHIYLFEAYPRLLSVMSDEASSHAFRFLENLGVIIKTSAQAKSYEGSMLFLENGESIMTDTVIWTAGVKPVWISGIDQHDYLTGKRIQVDEFNRLVGSNDIYAIGDVAAISSEIHPKGLPMLAPVAIQQARHLARNFKQLLQGDPLLPFKYKDKGVMATIGRKRAVVDLPKWKFQGLFAWLVWMFIHLMSLIGFRNRLRTLIDWSGSYFNYDKPLGIIIPELKKTD
jgi:NADH dehydrogenase